MRCTLCELFFKSAILYLPLPPPHIIVNFSLTVKTVIKFPYCSVWLVGVQIPIHTFSEKIKQCAVTDIEFGLSSDHTSVVVTWHWTAESDKYYLDELQASYMPWYSTVFHPPDSWMLCFGLGHGLPYLTAAAISLRGQGSQPTTHSPIEWLGTFFALCKAW